MALISLLVRLPVPAQTPAEASPNAVSKLVVTVGKSLVLESPVKITRLAAANSELIESIPIGPKEVLINGKLPGETSLVVWLDNQTRLTYDLLVRASPQRLNAVREQVARDLPGGDVDVTLDNDTAFVRGRVKDVFSAERVMAIAATLGKTVNLLRVDIPPVEPQILLHVKFANVDRTASSDLGLDLASTAFNQSTAAGTGSPLSQTGGPPFSLSQAVNLFLFRRDLNLAAAIHALEAKRQLQLLAEPNLMVINNTPARFVAGGEIPIPMVQAGGGSNSVTIVFKEYGIKLGFLPVVTPRGTIRLQVLPEVSSLDYTNSVSVAGTTVPGTSTRRVQTEVELESGQSFVIAGLLDSRTTENLSKIPGIGNIPLLGKLFQSRSISRNNSELLVIITPEIVRPIPAGQPAPALQFAPPLPFPNSPEPARQPGLDKTGPVPVHPPSDSMPVEQLIQMQKAAPGGASGPPGSTTPVGRLVGEERGRSGAESAVVASYRFRESPPGSGLAMMGKTLRMNGNGYTVTGAGPPQEFPGASLVKFVTPRRLSLPGGELVAPEFAGNALELRDRTMFPVVRDLRPDVTALRTDAGMESVARQLNQYGEEDQTPIIPRVRLTAGGRLVPLREQDLETSQRLPVVLLGSILLIALCLALLTGLAFGLVYTLQATRAGLAPALKEGGGFAAPGRRHLSMRNILVAGSLALLLIAAFLAGGSRRTAPVEIGLDTRNFDRISMGPVRDAYSAAPSTPSFQTVLDRGQRLPSVRAESLTETVPVGVIRNGAVTRAIHDAGRYVVGEDPVDAPGIPILRGRDFHKDDEAAGATEQLLRQYFLKE